MWGALIGAGASLAGSLLASQGQQQANQQNAALAREQMAFQERMSNTAYQRGMADMKAAGLNPILAYQKGGASTPGGALATMQNEGAAWSDGISNATNAVATASKYSKEREEETAIQQSINQSKSQEHLNKMAAANQVEQTFKTNAEIDQVKQATKNSFIQGKILEEEYKTARDWGPGQYGQAGNTAERAATRARRLLEENNRSPTAKEP